jgi:hypothetical protein
MECHDPLKFRKKIKGFGMPFNTRDKVSRIPMDELTKTNKTTAKFPNGIEGSKDKYGEDSSTIQRLYY